MPNSYEHSYQHDLDDVIDASDAVLAIGTEKVDTATLKNRSLNGNDATIHGAMKASGYFDGGRIYDGVDDYLDCGTISPFTNHTATLIAIISTRDLLATEQNIFTKADFGFRLQHKTIFRASINNEAEEWKIISSPTTSILNRKTVIICRLDNSNSVIFHDGIKGTPTSIGNFKNSSNATAIGIRALDYSTNPFKGTTHFIYASENIISDSDAIDFFNTLARLQLYSHNFERYPNSDTSLTSVFPYTSGIITSGSFNKTDGLKCASAGQIVFSNSFEFDGSECITLVIDDVEYSGTTTVTQGTITATIAQGSNDITIDMGTNDVLEDIRIQFRSEA